MLIAHDWQAKGYHDNSWVQRDAAKELLGRLPLGGTERILDIGCGTGKTTASLAQQAPHGSVVGLDLSSQMVAFAKTQFPRSSYPNLSFVLGDAQKMKFNNEFNLIVSIFALQWPHDLHAVVKGVSVALKESGQFAASIPLGISETLELATHNIATSDKWLPFYSAHPLNFQIFDPDGFHTILTQNSIVVNHFAVIQQKARFESKDHLISYIHQWFPYGNILPKALRFVFFTEVMNEYVRLLDTATMTFNRVDFIGHKRA
ncbi:MAG: trans-aconitate 2-methyltransferase [Candidatus Obscuribacterales bacterium]